MPRVVASRLFTALRSGFTDLRAGALERRVRQDPSDVTARCSAAALYCRQVGQVGQEETDSVLLDQAAEHLRHVLDATSNPHRLHEVISKTVGPKLFYRVPDLTAAYMRKIGLHSVCLKEFDTMSEFEERATPYHLANALTVLKAAGRREAAQTLFDEAVSLEWKGKQAIRWTCLEQTPAVYVEGLEHQPLWEGVGKRPNVAEILAAGGPEVHAARAELQELCRKRSELDSVPAYPALVTNEAGTWDMLQLYSGRKWHPEACALAPLTTALLQRHLPSSSVPYIHYNTEEVVLFVLTPGSGVRLHNGGSNVPINIHWGLSGCDGAFLEVAGQRREMQDGTVHCFDDGSDHRVWHDGAEDRWALTVRVMHPQLAENPASYFARAFTNRTCFESWDAARAASWNGGT